MEEEEVLEALARIERSLTNITPTSGGPNVVWVGGGGGGSGRPTIDDVLRIVTGIERRLDTLAERAEAAAEETVTYGETPEAVADVRAATPASQPTTEDGTLAASVSSSESYEVAYTINGGAIWVHVITAEGEEAAVVAAANMEQARRRNDDGPMVFKLLGVARRADRW